MRALLIFLSVYSLNMFGSSDAEASADLEMCNSIKQTFKDGACCGSGKKSMCAAAGIDDRLNTILPTPIVKGPKIKSSSLSYLNAAGRVDFDNLKKFNDFTGEGHMYPVHGVGDMDQTHTLMKKFLQSAQGEAFEITDLGIKIKVTDPSLTREKCFYDFHTIPTRILDGSTKLPDGKRVEDCVPYFNDGESKCGDSEMEINWSTGMARFKNAQKAGAKSGFAAIKDKEFPTSLASTRATPFLDQNSGLSLTFFMDGKQQRVTNGGKVSNWRYIVPQGVKKDLKWFVAKAMRPCATGEYGCEQITTTDGKSVMVKARTAAETENLGSIAYGENRYMKTVSTHSVSIGATKMTDSFNQRYSHKCVNFGDVMLLKKVGATVPTAGRSEKQIEAMNNVKEAYEEDSDAQIAFCKMLKAVKRVYADDFPGSNEVVKTPTAIEAEILAVLSWIRETYLKKDTYNMSERAMINKANRPCAYMQHDVCETGWLVVDEASELTVPNDDGEYFIGWVIETQPQAQTTQNMDERLLSRLRTDGFVFHQGPGITYMTCGDHPHVGTQEPYILEHNYAAAKQAGESQADFQKRRQQQLPTVHWRLDSNAVIQKSLQQGAVTEANVGAGQLMLASIGTKTALTTPSRSQNFLGKCYQELLSDRAKLRSLVGREPAQGEVYKVLEASDLTFAYGQEQQADVKTECSVAQVEQGGSYRV